ncbi:MAG: hypothetical protein SFX18_07420 [Pirellulales bacterium]|nr:hypothetical protein [Pirellulales bacterium]
MRRIYSLVLILAGSWLAAATESPSPDTAAPPVAAQTARSPARPERVGGDLMAARPQRETPDRPEEAVPVFTCDFGEAWDQNYDQWPDRWTRVTSSIYPHYLPVKIVPEVPNTDAEADAAALLAATSVPSSPEATSTVPPAPAGYVLRIELDGGGALVQSPFIPIVAEFTYMLEANLRTAGLRQSAAFVSITYFDAKRQPVESMRSPPLVLVENWHTVRIATGSPPRAGVTHAVIGLHLEPLPGQAGDLRGQADFAELWLGRLPRITLTANRPNLIYLDAERPEIICRASGLNQSSAKVVFELLDHQSRQMQELVELELKPERNNQEYSSPQKKLFPPQAPLGAPLHTGMNPSPLQKSSHPPVTEVDPGHPQTPSVAVGALANPGEKQQVFSGQVTWKPPITQPGFYKVRVQMPGELGSVTLRELTLVLMNSKPAVSGGEFGWSLPRGEAGISFGELADLAGNSGISWLKLPVWNAANQPGREEQILWLAERLGLKKIEMVAMLTDPPDTVREAISGVDTSHAAGVFSAPSTVWYPTLEPLVSRLSTRVRHWQLGTDQDFSFIGFSETEPLVQNIRKLFARFGQRMQFLVAWDWLRELPAEKPAWDIAVLSTRPALTAAEQRQYLQGQTGQMVKKWTVIEPLSAEEYAQETRIADLVQRMVEAKTGGATAIFVGDLIDSRTGLLNNDGTASPLYLPWRTTAYELAGAEYQGELALAPNVQNRLFQRGTDAVLVLWADAPQQVRLNAGPGTRIVDVWGRVSTPVRDGEELVLPLGAEPIFLTRVNVGLLRFQMHVQFAQTRLANLFGRPQTNGLVLSNSFNQSVSGSVKFEWPESWRTASREITFKLAPRETATFPVELILPINAGTGKQTVKMRVFIDAERAYEFRTERELEVGLDDIFAEYTTRLTPRGDLEIEQRLTNQTEEAVSFKCYLFAPERKRLALQVQDHGRGIDLKTFFLPNASDLIGEEIYVRAEEVSGSRVLNYRFKVTP